MRASNQHLQDNILFISNRGAPITELRRLDKDRLVLYTESQAIYERFREWTQLIKKILYTRSGKKILFVGVDLYFPVSARKQLLKALAVAPKVRAVSEAHQVSPGRK